MRIIIMKHKLPLAAFLLSLILWACASKSRIRPDEICGICGKDLGWVSIVSEGKQYHPDCFENNSNIQCTICRKPIFDQYVKDGAGACHLTCFKETKLKRCSVCNLPMEGEYIGDVWGQGAHKDHNGQPLVMCDSCGRIICPASGNGVRYQDGRSSCGICKSSAVLDDKTIFPVMAELSKLLSKKGIGPFSLKTIRVELVDCKSLDPKYTSGSMRNKRGETQTSFMSKGGVIVGWTHRIRIQYGLPMTLFKGILAHEMLHVWLNENKVKMTDRETEGFCNLGILLVAENEGTDFSRVLRQNLEQNTDEVYGEGYRLMKARLDKLGWPAMVSHVKKRT